VSLRVAVAGCGYFSRFHHRAWARMPDVALAATCDRDRAKAQAMADAVGVPAVFDDAAAMLDAIRPDLLDIAAPPPAHLALIREAAARGIAIVCQKPFCTSLAEAEQAVATAEAAGITLIVHENFRFQPWYAQIARLLRAGALGTPYQITFRLRPGDGQGPHAYLDRQPGFQAMPRFLVRETAIHQIDLFRHLFGEPAGILASLQRRNPAIAGEDSGLLLLDWDDGKRALFDGNRLADHAARNRRLTMGEVTLEGADATLFLDGDAGLWLRPHGSNVPTRVPYVFDDIDFGGDCVFRLQRHVADHLLHGAPAMNTGREYLANLRIEEAAYLSARTGARVALAAQ
jgi:predicted dehydrogenase